MGTGIIHQLWIATTLDLKLAEGEVVMPAT